MDILFDEIPSLDLADFTSGNPEKKAEFVHKLGEAYQNIGFVAIKNHGLSKGCGRWMHQLRQPGVARPGPATLQMHTAPRVQAQWAWHVVRMQ